MLEGTRQLKSTFVIHDEVLRWLGMRFLVIVDGTWRLKWNVKKEIMGMPLLEKLIE